MCRKGFSDKELEKLLYEGSDSELDDNTEADELSSTDTESDDSVCDPNYNPTELDEDDVRNCLMNIWRNPNADTFTPPTKKTRLLPPEVPSCSGLQEVVSYFRKFYIHNST